MPNAISTKSELRQALLANRQAMPAEVRREMDSRIGERLKAWCVDHPFRVLGVYWPIRGEPDLRNVYEKLSADGMKLALPVVTRKDAPLRFIAWAPGDAMQKDQYGIGIPASDIEVRPDAVLVPCVGFNEQRFRLGYGGGFYDRTLAQLPRPVTVGVAYASSLTAFEADAFDIALDRVITESMEF
ncbi:5-formyltetrahydrofolate cyclo-ligase [Noviherbaspirillum malthae]|jgi:5,10-methenyltetrahydrofolate synthetase|uniref:5-formyltetrahydrofolate cyclo-ligase n=1 Tax=Noviherbaspirillum malthae TaxID=1260987 RepID=UPI001E515952|nr:5-formyltetrahydrofolate cyclo-ligase [Noviherbaspirillum malthae]